MQEETLTTIFERLEYQLVYMRAIDNNIASAKKFKRSFCRFFDNKNFATKKRNGRNVDNKHEK